LVVATHLIRTLRDSVIVRWRGVVYALVAPSVRVPRKTGLSEEDLDKLLDARRMTEVMTEYWGRGLATEMAEAILRVAFEGLGMTDVVCFTLTTNRAS
jgi:hypothetical protein